MESPCFSTGSLAVAYLHDVGRSGICYGTWLSYPLSSMVEKVVVPFAVYCRLIERIEDDCVWENLPDVNLFLVVLDSFLLLDVMSSKTEKTF